jgi:hypothetical protein
MTDVTVSTGDENISVDTSKITGYKVTVANGLFYTTEGGSPISIDGSNNYLIIENGIKVEAVGIEVDVSPP